MYEIIHFPLTEKMTTGVTKVDEQHRELLRLAENLVNSIGKQLSNDSVKENLFFLSRYAVNHFKDEELLQQDVNYPGYEVHKQIHADFVETLLLLKQQYTLEGNTLCLQEKLNDSVISWVIDHICGEDKKFAVYYKEEMDKKEAKA